MRQMLISEWKYARLTLCSFFGILLTAFFLVPYIWSIIGQTHPNYAPFWKEKYQKEAEFANRLEENYVFTYKYLYEQFVKQNCNPDTCAQSTKLWTEEHKALEAKIVSLEEEYKTLEEEYKKEVRSINELEKSHAREIHNLKKEFIKSTDDTQEMKLWKEKHQGVFWKHKYNYDMKLCHHNWEKSTKRRDIQQTDQQSQHEKVIFEKDKDINLWKRKYEKKEEASSSVQDNSNVFFCFLGAFLVVVVEAFLNRELQIQVVEVHSINRTECTICMNRIVEAVFVPCGHVFCHECASRIGVCPLCRRNNQIVKLFFP